MTRKDLGRQTIKCDSMVNSHLRLALYSITLLGKKTTFKLGRQKADMQTLNVS